REIRPFDEALFEMLGSLGVQLGQFIGRNYIEKELAASVDQLRQAQKMEAVGRLAGGVAHDFNNLLTVITGYSELLLDRAVPGGPDRTKLIAIKQAADRAAGLTKQLLAFSRRQVLEPRVLDLNATVGETSGMLRRLIGEDVELATSLAPDLGRVLADPGQLVQVLMNLAVNARDAMPGGGKLTLETSNVDLDDEYVDTHVAVVPGPYVLLAVSDSGTGMDAETQRRAFEPFFTTKPAGQGTGLGLSTVYGIVKQSGGNIWLYSEPGRGTTVKIYLPRVEATVAVGTGTADLPPPERGNATILMVEDEDAVREIMVEALRGQGYTVLAAPAPAAALALSDGHAPPIDLLVTDMVMPGMGGQELAKLLAARRPAMKILFISGYAEQAAYRQNLIGAGQAFLQKPFTPRGLARKVREVLEGVPHVAPAAGSDAPTGAATAASPA
ncbi:MAG: ATP-binding protein, partial [bacterium]